MKKLVILILAVALIACASPGREGLSFTERVAADKEWYCGPGMFGVRAVARFFLGVAGVPIPDTCKLVDAIIQESAAQRDA